MTIVILYYVVVSEYVLFVSEYALIKCTNDESRPGDAGFWSIELLLMLVKPASASFLQFPSPASSGFLAALEVELDLS